MNKEKEPLFIGVDTVMFDLGVSRAKHNNLKILESLLV